LNRDALIHWVQYDWLHVSIDSLFFTTGFSPKSPKDMLASFRDESANQLPEESQWWIAKNDWPE